MTDKYFAKKIWKTKNCDFTWKCVGNNINLGIAIIWVEHFEMAKSLRHRSYRCVIRQISFNLKASDMGSGQNHKIYPMF